MKLTTCLVFMSILVTTIFPWEQKFSWNAKTGLKENIYYKESNGKNQSGVDKFGGKYPQLKMIGRQTIPVHNRRPQKFKYPRQFD